MSVCARLREHLAASRRRGVPFETAWPHALDAALCLETPSDARDWRRVLQPMSGRWRDCYLRVGVSSAIGVLAERDGTIPCGPRQCDWCDGDLPASRVASHARFCSDDCKRLARQRRERLAV